MDLLQLQEALLQERRADDEASKGLPQEAQLLEEVRQLLRQDAQEALEAFQQLGPKLLGAVRRGRRGAFDEGKATAKLALSVADLQAKRKLGRGLERACEAT